MNDAMMWMSTVCIVFLVLLFLVYAYIRNKFKFWALQPVFHVYDFGYYLFPPGILLHELPEPNKYCNFKNIETIPFSKLNDFKIQKCLQFIQRHYLRNRGNIFSPSKQHFQPYFVGHNTESYFSFYTQDEWLLDIKTNEGVEHNKIIAVMTGRPLHVYMGDRDTKNELDVYYVDYLCVDSTHRKNGIAPQVIQTHEYNQRRANKNIQVSLFKREGELTGIVPLCVYKTCLYTLQDTVSSWMPLSNHIDWIQVGPQNAVHLIDFMRDQTSRFSVVGVVETGNLMELIKTQNIYCTILKEEHDVLAAYFFRKSCTYIGGKDEVLTCFASILKQEQKTRKKRNKEKELQQLFLQGFQESVLKIKKDHPQFQFTVIENISDNDILIRMLSYEPMMTSPTAYFFYNFAYPTFPAKEVLMIH